jgi:hypothetical protein
MAPFGPDLEVICSRNTRQRQIELGGERISTGCTGGSTVGLDVDETLNNAFHAVATIITGIATLTTRVAILVACRSNFVIARAIVTLVVGIMVAGRAGTLCR